VSFGAYFYAESLEASLDRSVTEKSYIAYGGDAQAIVDQTMTVPRNFPFPATRFEYGNQAASVGGASGPAVDLLAVDPASIGRVIPWYPDWGPDPRPRAGQLNGTGPLPVIAGPGTPATPHAIWVQGMRIPVRVVARVKAFPGMTSTPFFVLSASALDRAARRMQLYDPMGSPQTMIWAKGAPGKVAAALSSPLVEAAYITDITSFTHDPSVVLARRMFRYMRLVAISAGLLVFAGLLLYLQSRQRSQAVASALAGRMGLRRRTEIASLALELAAIALLAAVVGGLVALAAAQPIVRHVDPLPDSPPAPSLVTPLWPIALSAAFVLAFVFVAAAVTSWRARRTDMGEALRVV
jgi:hypothetical protein